MFFLSRLSLGDIFLDIPPSDFKSVMFHMFRNSRYSKKKEAFEAVIAREDLGSTTLGHGVALPHCRLKGFSGFYVKFALFRDRPGYVAPNGQEARFVFLVVGPEEEREDYLHYLSHIVKVMGIPRVRDELLSAKNKKEIRVVLRRYGKEELEKRAPAWR